MELKKIEDLVEKGLLLSCSEISGEAFKTLTEFLKKELEAINYTPCCKSDSEQLNTTEKRNIFNEGYSLGLKTGKRQLDNSV